VRRIDCSDFLPGAVACKHVLEAETDEELLEQARAHVRDEHPDLELDEARVREAVRFTATSFGGSPAGFARVARRRSLHDT
jgi:predicted small metal-binding protein